MIVKPFSLGLVRGCVSRYIDGRVAGTRIWMTGGRGCSLLLFCVLLLGSGVAGQTPATPVPTTAVAPPSTTPVPGIPLKLSFVIDGKLFYMTCNITGLNMSNCTFDMDHGLTVSKDSAGTTTNIPDSVLYMIIVTLVLVTILLIITGIGFWMKKPEMFGYGQVPQQMPQQVPQQMPVYYGQGNRMESSRKVIGVGLVKPCLPGDTGMP